MLDHMPFDPLEEEGWEAINNSIPAPSRRASVRMHEYKHVSEIESEDFVQTLASL